MVALMRRTTEVYQMLKHRLFHWNWSNHRSVLEYLCLSLKQYHYTEIELAVVIPVLGVILAETSNTGVVLVTVSPALEVTAAFKLSVIVATQVISSVGLEFVEDNTNVSPDPNSVSINIHPLIGWS